MQEFLPLVLHRIVRGQPTEWEDVREQDFRVILREIRSGCAIPGVTTLSTRSGWVLTFDDGNISDYEVVFPLLLESNVKALFFIISDRIGDEGYLNWTQIREMHRYGMCFGSHSAGHNNMTQIPRDYVIDEFVKSKRVLEHGLGCSIDTFSFPFGDFNAKTIQIGHECGYEYLYTSAHGLYRKGKLIPRNSINSRMSVSQVRQLLYATTRQKLLWTIEDNLKGSAKSILGETIYTSIRNKLFKG